MSVISMGFAFGILYGIYTVATSTYHPDEESARVSGTFAKMRRFGK